MPLSNSHTQKYHDYKKLSAYKKANNLTREVYVFVYKEKNLRPNDYLINQLLRSVSSVGANIAEGYGRYYKKSFRRFLAIARGSSFETEYWLELLTKLKPQYNVTFKKFISKNQEIMKLLTTMMKNLDN
ncbi:four helix bundle protein [Candidatus Woesebacteria bacterium]|nr:four helix bundle protein [Candidatus Woesebacteria bacterium]